MKACGSVWALVPVAGLALASVASQGSAARRVRRPRRPGIHKNLARERLKAVLPPFEDLEYLGVFQGRHRFLFWDLREKRSRTAEADGLSSQREHFMYWLD
jgi:hypothetical protein